MKRYIWAFGSGVFLLLFVLSETAQACPACNIHNYLAKSIQSSNNIFFGKVLREINDTTAEVEVIKTLRGAYKKGEKVRTKMYEAKEDIGKEYIFSDPTSWPPTFEVLPLEFEDEIRFLIQKEPAVKDLQEAIKRVQGVSVVTQKIGMEYIAKHHDAAVKPLIAELHSLTPQVFSAKDVFYGEYRIGKLADALLLKPTDAGKQYVLDELKALTKRDAVEINWKAIPQCPSSQGIFLQYILALAQKDKELSPAVGKHLKEIYPTLSGLILAEINYAILVSGTETVEALQASVNSDDNTNALALGLFFAGNIMSQGWQFDKAYTFWDKAAELATRPELKKAISKNIKQSEGFNKRKNNAKGQSGKTKAHKSGNRMTKNKKTVETGTLTRQP